MRSRTADWYETKIRYEKTMEDGAQKKVTEQYVVDALSFTEAENTNDDRWYTGKLQFITLDEKAEKEKRTAVNYLVQAASLPGAVKHIDEVMGSTQIDYVISSVAETMIMDVYEHSSAAKTVERHDVPEYLTDENKQQGENA